MPNNKKTPRQSRHGPNVLFLTGLVLSLAFILMDSIIVKSVFLVIFIAMNVARKHKIAVIPSLLTAAAIIAFNAFTPLGKELAVIWGFSLTEGALLSGIERAVTFEGLLLASKATVSRNLRLPGQFGGIVSESFRYFGIISGRKTKITFKNFHESIDTLMMELEEETKTP